MANINIKGTPVGENTNHEWHVEVDTGDGLRTVEGVTRARFLNMKRDQAFILAESPDSTSANSFSSVRRVGGGGAVNVLYAVSPEGHLWLGGVMQRRTNISNDPIFNTVRGYSRPNEDNLSAAIRESLEETGRDDLMKPVLLPGETVNADSAVFDSQNGGGVDFFRVEVPYNALVMTEDGRLAFDQTGLTDEQLKEGIYKVLFIPGDITTVARLADGFTVIGFVRLLAYLKEASGIDLGAEVVRPYHVG